MPIDPHGFCLCLVNTGEVIPALIVREGLPLWIARMDVQLDTMLAIREGKSIFAVVIQASCE